MNACKVCGKPVRTSVNIYCSHACRWRDSAKPIPEYAPLEAFGQRADKCRKARELRISGYSINKIVEELKSSRRAVGRYLNPDWKPYEFPKEKRICPTCGNIFEERPKTKKVYCSAGCYKVFCESTREEVACRVCGKIFAPNSRQSACYCSNRCRQVDQGPRPKICPVCKRAFMPERFSNGIWSKVEWCSAKCYWVDTEFAPPPLSETKHTCQYCGKEFKRYGEKAKYCSKYCSSMANYKGGFQPARENHWNWQGGKTRESTNEKLRKSTPYKKWRKSVLARDNWTCQDCGAVQKKGPAAHHVFPFAEFPEHRYELWNGITLCRSCHMKTHGYELEHR